MDNGNHITSIENRERNLLELGILKTEGTRARSISSLYLLLCNIFSHYFSSSMTHQYLFIGPPIAILVTCFSDLAVDFPP